jgi:hypothetical protein
MQKEGALELWHSVAVGRTADITTCREDEPAASPEAPALHVQGSFFMFSHRFNSGQTVHAKANPWAALAGAYEIVCRLPMSGGDNQYWVKSLGNGDHRVVRQSDLVAEPRSDGDFTSANRRSLPTAVSEFYLGV